MAEHISIFVENRPGRLEKITKILYENDINIRAISVASAGEFGIVKILVNNPKLAYKKLKEKNITVALRKILAIIIKDKPGFLYKVLNLLSQNNINIEDSYGFILKKNKLAVVIIESENFPQAEEILKKNNIKILSDKEVLSL